MGFLRQSCLQTSISRFGTHLTQTFAKTKLPNLYSTSTVDSKAPGNFINSDSATISERLLNPNILNCFQGLTAIHDLPFFTSLEDQ